MCIRDRYSCIETGKTALTEPYIDSSTGEIILSAATPVYDEGGNVLGAAGTVSYTHLDVYKRQEQHRPEVISDKETDHKKAADIETECAVLLENNGILPLNTDRKVAYIGEFAEKPRYQGGGSSHINPFRVVSALDARCV